MIKELDIIALTVDLPEEQLKAGDMGTVVHIYQGQKAYEVEFMTLDGETVGVVHLLPSQARAIGHHEIANTRRLAEVSQ